MCYQIANESKEMTLQTGASWLAVIIGRHGYRTHVIMRPEGGYVYTDCEITEQDIKDYAAKVMESGNLQVEFKSAEIDYPFAFLHF